MLAPLKRIAPAEFELALQRLSLAAVPAAPRLESNPAGKADASLDPKRFLLDVMNNASLDLALRVEAAKALLPYFDAVRGQRQELE